MVWKLGELQSVYNELRFNVETASPCTNLLKLCWLTFHQHGWVIRRCDAIGRLLHTKYSLSSPCTSQHKHEQKDKTNTFVKYPDHIFIDFAQIFERFIRQCRRINHLNILANYVNKINLIWTYAQFLCSCARFSNTRWRQLHTWAQNNNIQKFYSSMSCGSNFSFPILF